MTILRNKSISNVVQSIIQCIQQKKKIDIITKAFSERGRNDEDKWEWDADFIR